MPQQEYTSASCLGWADYNSDVVHLSLYGPKGGRMGGGQMSPEEAIKLGRQLLKAGSKFKRLKEKNMARFRGTVAGNRGEASRLGRAMGGLEVNAQSWSGAVCTRLYASGDDQTRDGGPVDNVRITAEQHGSSRNPTGIVFDGTFEELGQLINWWQHRDQINAVMALLSADEIDEAAIRSVRRA